MTDNVSNLILEQLALLRRGQDELRQEIADLRQDVGDLKDRMSGVEMQASQLQSQFAHVGAPVAIQSGCFDRVEQRLGRIERRLDLAPA